MKIQYKGKFKTYAEYARFLYWRDIKKTRERNNLRARKRRIDYPEWAKKMDKLYSKKYADKNKIRYSNPINKLKYSARNRLWRAVKLKIIKKPKICTKCKKKKPLQGHHKDYLKPLKVIWLCQKCHTETHYPRLHRW